MKSSTPQPPNDGRKPDGRFANGNRANPRGKPKGTRHRVTKAVEALLYGEAEQLTRKAIQLALGGDMTALRLCLDRIAPARRDRPVLIELPPIDSAADHPPALAAILRSVVDGEITPSEAQALSSVLAEHRKAIETAEFEARIATLEEGTNHA
jgi:hypothetical protein